MPRKKEKRHSFNRRPPPHWEYGYFVPSIPELVPKHPDDWTRWELFKSVWMTSRNPVAASTEVTQTDPVTRSRVLNVTLTVAHDPAMIRHCFVENARNYDLHPLRQAVLKPILKDGLLTSEGDIWRHSRRVISPIFVPRQVKTFGPRMRETIDDILPRLFNEPGKFSFSQKMLELAYVVLSDSLFSGDIQNGTEAVLKDVASFLKHLGNPDPLDIIQAPSWMPRLSRLRGRKAIQNMRGMIRELILMRREKMESDQSVPEDFLTHLLMAGVEEGKPLSDDEIEDQLLTFIGAGHETTSRALTWMYYLLSQDTSARDRLEAEVDALDTSLPPDQWDQHMPWAMACFEEAMRLFPPAPIISRIAKEDDHFEGLEIKATTSVLINLWTLHRHETLWERPFAFDPARFLPEQRGKIDRFQYLPFGLGHRVCIGQRFAMQEAAILIALISKKYRFDYATGKPPWPVMRVTIQSENGMPMIVERRD